MRVVVGLGNIGKRYAYTRHNVGFMVIEKIVNKNSMKLREGKGDFLYSKYRINESDSLIMIPTTFMNNSGLAVRQVQSEFNLPIENFLIICDDVNLDLAKIRLRAKGSDGGHNGLASIISEIGSNSFPRLRIGISSNFEKGRQAEYVLSKFKKEELDIIEPALELSAEICEKFLGDGLDEAKNFYSKEISRLKNKLIIN